MPDNHSHSLRSFYSAPPLSAVIHSSNPQSNEDGFCLPSGFHSRTWLLDNFQETSSETTGCQLTNCEQDVHTKDLCAQCAFLPRVVQTTSINSRCNERTTCPSGGASAALECVSQACQARSNQQIGCTVRRFQPASYMTRGFPPKTYVSKSCQTLECEYHQCQVQSHGSSGCRPLVCVSPGPQLLESSSSTYEPTCCVTGGLQLSSK
ncbi:keratin-associated protein 27-1 [Choloepus didactylus]|uniref:keratin-associated protein 27-1 n=1 Tax=Choloepus didactylus TaxID=27675 RepID=UPI00189FBEB7|nr:keratin-associated protein 27-1 [Choloepus didactylus]